MHGVGGLQRLADAMQGLDERRAKDCRHVGAFRASQERADPGGAIER
jgi:hypothetical protein